MNASVSDSPSQMGFDSPMDDDILKYLLDEMGVPSLGQALTATYTNQHERHTTTTIWLPNTP